MSIGFAYVWFYKGSYILFCYASSITNEGIQTNLVTCYLFPVVMTSTPRHASNNLPQPVEIKILMVWLINTTYFLRILKKLNLILLVTCQWITSKKYWRLWSTQVNTWACDTVRWYWSPDTLFWQLSIYHNMNVQYQAAPGLPN